MAKIVISYRRLDSDVFAGRVRDRIASRFGEDSVFIDVDNIPFGKDFRVHIQEVLGKADAVLVVVGPKWLGRGKGSNRRIMDDTDPVRIELETALSKRIPTIPILVGHANMPKPEHLPESLRNFAFINAAPVDTGRNFHRDLDRVIDFINTIIEQPMDTVEKATLSSDSTAAAQQATEPQRREEGAKRREEKERSVTKPIFVGYSHKDAKWLYKVRPFLRPLEELGQIGFWNVTTELQPFGARLTEWLFEIRMAFKSARIVVFLASQNFFDSPLIGEKEVPGLVEAAINRGCLIFWIPVEKFPSIEGSPFAKFIPPNTPLELLSEREQKEVLNEISRKIMAAAGPIK